MTSTLTERKYWDSIHVSEQLRISDSADQKFFGALKKILGSRLVGRMSGYDDYLLWNVILPKALPNVSGAKFVEIGSAPGEYSVEFSKRQGCIPFGVEYSSVGVEVNREVFRQNGFSSDNVINADFFSAEFVEQYREKFDGVISKGFVEHFEDVKSVIDKHMQLLKPDGYLVVTIPNLSGFNNLLGRLFDEDAIPRHNVSIMRQSVYRQLFNRNDLQTIFCDYYGTFSFYLFTAGESSLRKHLLRICHKLQPLLNLTFRTTFGAAGAETSLFSPFLLYIGRKL